MVPVQLLRAEITGDTGQPELRGQNPFALRRMVTSAGTLPTQGQPGWNAAGEPHREAGSLLKDPSKVRKGVVEGQLSSPTDPAESPMKELSLATPEGVQVSAKNAICANATIAFDFQFTPTLATLHSISFLCTQ